MPLSLLPSRAVRHRLTALLTSTTTALSMLVAAVALGVVTGVGLTVTTATPAEAVSPAGTYSRQATRWANKRREGRGRVALDPTRCLRAKAKAQARRMADQERLFHQDLDAVIRDCDLDGAAENTAVGYASGAKVVNQGWMKSRPHRRNLLWRDHRLVGTGAVRADGRWWAVQLIAH